MVHDGFSGISSWDINGWWMVNKAPNGESQGISMGFLTSTFQGSMDECILCMDDIQIWMNTEQKWTQYVLRCNPCFLLPFFLDRINFSTSGNLRIAFPWERDEFSQGIMHSCDLSLHARQVASNLSAFGYPWKTSKSTSSWSNSHLGCGSNEEIPRISPKSAWISWFEWRSAHPNGELLTYSHIFRPRWWITSIRQLTIIDIDIELRVTKPYGDLMHDDAWHVHCFSATCPVSIVQSSSTLHPIDAIHHGPVSSRLPWSINGSWWVSQ